MLFLAAGVRLYRLGLQCLTGDEAFSLLAAQRWLTGTMDLYGPGSIESTPPLHYLLLSGWVAIAGPSEFAGRFLSVLAGVLLVAGAVAVGRALGQPRIGLFFGLLASVSPFLVAYSQTARSYSLLACLGVLSTLAAVKCMSSAGGIVSDPLLVGPSRTRTGDAVQRLASSAGAVRTRDRQRSTSSKKASSESPDQVVETVLRGEGGIRLHQSAAQEASVAASTGSHHKWLRPYAAYIVVTTLALYTHTFGALLLPFHGLLYIVWPRPRPTFRSWGITLAAVVLLALPWWARAFGLSSNPAEMWLERGGILERLLAVLESVAVGPSAASAWPDVSLAAGSALIALPFIAGAVPTRRGWPTSSRVAAAWVAGCCVAALVISLQVPLLRDRFLIVAAPGLLMGAAVGVSRLGSTRVLFGVVALLASVTPALAGLRANYLDVPFATSREVQALVEHIASRRLADSAFVTNLPKTDPFFQYYDPRLPPFFIPDAQPGDLASGSAALRGLMVGHSDVWLVPFPYGSESDRFVERQLTETGYRAEDLWFGHLRLQRYAIGHEQASARATDVSFLNEAGRIRLTRVQLAPSPAVRGAVLRVELDWRPSGPTAQPYTVFAHLVDARGAVVAQRDSEPVGGYRPTTAWLAGESVIDHLGVPLPRELASGDYTLLIGLYSPEGRRLSNSGGGEFLQVTGVEVAAAH
jgi:4-amino-4-deoxy-L-arabinose transferase-like glycosyltransferase